MRRDKACLVSTVTNRQAGIHKGRPYQEFSMKIKLKQASVIPGFGLTLGVHSRNEETARRIEALARVGNLYVNRNQIGAVVGCQPFGGLGLSRTGPPARGPHYLPRFCWEQTLSVDTAAAGGNASLLAQAAQFPEGP
jgi:RHH-type proline utilization regulon transcriptional repressor/proline dehydrogenase/delta 1-pyrroline-5-carboxylate dehydrogenase